MSKQQQQQYDDMKAICYFKSHSNVFIILGFKSRLLFVINVA